METNLFVYIISHITITGYKTKTTTALHAFKIHHKLSVVSSLNNACSYPEPALTHLSMYTTSHSNQRWPIDACSPSSFFNNGHLPLTRATGFQLDLHLGFLGEFSTN